MDIHRGSAVTVCSTSYPTREEWESSFMDCEVGRSRSSEEQARYSWTGALTAVWENCPEWFGNRTRSDQHYSGTRSNTVVHSFPHTSLILPIGTPSEQHHKKTTNTDDQTRRDHRSGPHQWQRQRKNSKNTASGSKHIRNITWTSVQWQWIILRLM